MEIILIIIAIVGIWILVMLYVINKTLIRSTEYRNGNLSFIARVLTSIHYILEKHTGIEGKTIETELYEALDKFSKIANEIPKIKTDKEK